MTTAPLLLDVRPILAQGGQPMQAVLEAVDRLQPGQSLRLVAPFRPEPLFGLLEKRGYDAHASDQPDGGCEVLFMPRMAAEPVSALVPSPLIWADPVLHLDLTDHAMQASSERILSMMDDLQEGMVLFALLSREPVTLYSELTSRGHAWVGNFASGGDGYRMLIRRGPGL